MKLSVNWVRHINNKYQCSADPMTNGIDKLVEKIGAQLGAVEEVIDVGKKYEGVVVAKVISCEKHPNADKLSLCLIDDGKAVKGVKRDAKGLVQVVCGAPNVAAGQLVAWIPPGVAVPSTISSEELQRKGLDAVQGGKEERASRRDATVSERQTPADTAMRQEPAGASGSARGQGKAAFVLEAREIRGVVSNGMIASAKELDLGDNHSGILEIDQPAKPGQPFVEVYDLDDYIIDIENKMFTHRPDLFGQLGIARELAGIQGHVFKSPAWYTENPALPKQSGAATHKLVIKNQIPKLVPRFSAVVIKDVKVAPSPIWLQTYLLRVGIRPINNIVDLTNYFMMLSAQPLHAYDYDKLANGIIEIRQAKPNETLTLLGGKKIKLDKEDIVIASGGQAVGLGGVMGGVDVATEVTAETKTIALEVANFGMNSIRHTAMTHGLFTEAATRFTKNQSPRQILAVLVKAIDDIKKIAGGRQASKVVDDNRSTVHNQRSTVKTNTEFINQRLGLDLSAAQIKKILENVEFKVQTNGENLKTETPFWRTDIEIPEDIVEEVGRLYGYDHLPLELPAKDLTPAAKNSSLDLKQRIREILSAAGANEVLTYSFVHGSLIKSAGQDVKEAYHIKNALSPDLQYYRLSLTPSLLEKVHPNIKDGFDNFVLFELGRAHIRSVLDNEKLPAELERLTIVVADKKENKKSGAPYYHAKHLVLYLTGILGIGDFISVPLAEAQLPPAWRPAAKAFEYIHSAAVFSGQTLLGLVGEPSSSLRTALKLPPAAQAELDVAALAQAASGVSYEPLNRFPSLEQDITFKVPTQFSYAEVVDFVSSFLDKNSQPHGYQGNVSPLDIFQKPGDKKTKNITLRIIMSHPQRTLVTAEVNKLLDQLAVAAKKELMADRV